MKSFFLCGLVLAQMFLSGCGATYTTTAPRPATTPSDECPQGMDYKTGRCL